MGPWRPILCIWGLSGGAGLTPEKTETLYAELNERAEAATSSYSVTGNLLESFRKQYQSIQQKQLQPVTDVLQSK